MKTIFTFVFVFVLFVGNVLGNDQKSNATNIIAVQTIGKTSQEKQPKSLHPQSLIIAYYNIEEKSVVVEFKTNQGTGLVELKDNVGNVVEAQTVDTSIQSVLTLPLPTQPGEYTLLINTDVLVGVGIFNLE